MFGKIVPWARTNCGQIVTVALLAILSLRVSGQQASTWVKKEESDTFSGKQYLQFSLDGRFLTPPRNTAPDTRPTMILRCTPGSFTRGHIHGKLISGYIYLGAVVDTRRSYLGGAAVDVKFRLDNGKIHTTPWRPSSDYSSIFFGDTDLDTLFYGHFLPHKINTTPAVKKVVIEVDEYLGSEIVMQFDLPDAASEFKVADACGVIWHKHKK